MLETEDKALCELGDQAEFLMRTPAFVNLLSELDANYYKHWVRTGHQDVEAREFLFAKAAALQDMVNDLTSRVVVRDQLMARLRLDEETEV
jgi:hypothetical protein